MDSLDKLLAPDDEESSDDDEEYSFDISSMYHVADRISFRGVFLADSNDATSETRIDFIEATHCPCCGKAHFEEEHKTIKLR